MNKGGVVVSKKEMTKMRVGDQFLPVTIVKVAPQEIIRYKNQEKDWYVAAIVGVGKKELKKEKGSKVAYKMVTEFKVDDTFVQAHEVGKLLNIDFLGETEMVTVIGKSKGKGFQGMMKRCHAHGMPKTHGHKFTRLGGSKGNRKPRRTLKGHPHAGHMGTDQITLKNIKILEKLTRDNEDLLVLKGSLPGSYNGLLKLNLQ